MYTYEKHGIHKSRGNYQDCKWLILWARGIWKTRFFNELFFFSFFFFTSDWWVEQASFLNSSYKNYHVKKIWESHSKGQHLCIFRRFVNEPGHPMKNRTGVGGGEVGGGRSKHARCGTMHTWFSSTDVWNRHTHSTETSRGKNMNSTTRLLQVNWLTDAFTSVFFFFFK